MPVFATLQSCLMKLLTPSALLLMVSLALNSANAAQVSGERQASIAALGYALAPLVQSDDRPSLEKALAALSTDKLHIAVIFDEDLTPIAHTGINSAFQGLDEGEALSDPISLWAVELNTTDVATFQLGGKDVVAIASPIILADQKLASLLVVEQPTITVAVPKNDSRFQHALIAGLLLAAATIFGLYLFTLRSQIRLTKRLSEFATTGPWITHPKKNGVQSSVLKTLDHLAENIASTHNLYASLNRLGHILAQLSSTNAPSHAIKNQILRETEAIFDGAAIFVTVNDLVFSAGKRNSIELASKKYSLQEVSKALGDCQSEQGRAVIELGGASYSLNSVQVDSEWVNAHQLILITDKPFDAREQELFREYGENIHLFLALLNSRQTLSDQLAESNRRLSKEHQLRVDAQDWCKRLRSISQKGYAFIGADGRFIDGASHSFACIFSTNSVSGKTLQEVLFNRCQLPHEQIRQAIAAIELLLDSDSLMFEFNKNKLPHRLTLINEDGTRDELALHWQAITQDNEVRELYLEVNSVAREVALEAQVKALQQEVELVGQVLKAPADAFGQFILAATEAFDAIGSILKGSTAVISQEQALNIYQDIHKLKRESRRLCLVQVTEALYQLELLVDTSHRAESEYANCIEVLSAVQEVKHALQRYQHVDENILMRSESADQKGLSIKQVHAIRTQINALQGSLTALDQQKIDQISSLLTKASYTTLSHVLNYIGSHCEDIAINLGKAPPVMHLESSELWLADDAVKQVRENLMQLVNHIICHSIETIPERAKANKPPAGQIYVTFAERDAYIEITCKNDGKGISFERLSRYQINTDSGTSIDAGELLSPIGSSRSTGTKKGNDSLPFTIHFIANASGYHSYEGILHVPLALCWHDSSAKPIAHAG